MKFGSKSFVFIFKEFKHVLRDRRSLFFLMAQPVMMMLLFGFALSNEVKESNIAVIDQSNDLETIKLIDRFEQSKYFHIAERLTNTNEIDRLFRQGRIRLAIIIHSNFANNLNHLNQGQIQIIADGSDPNTASIATSYLSAILRDYQNELLGDKKLPYSIAVETRMLYNPQLKSAFNFVPGVMTLILMLLGAMMTSVSIVREKEQGSMELLLASPINPIRVVISKAIPYLLLAFLNVVIILFIAVFVLNVPIQGSVFLLLMSSLLFISTTLSLGLFISSVTEQQQVAMFISLIGLLMPALVFSGFMFPIENMPKIMQIISNIVPTRWYYAIVRAIMIKGLGLSSIWKECLILAGMTFFFMTLAIKKFKPRLQ